MIEISAQQSQNIRRTRDCRKLYIAIFVTRPDPTQPDLTCIWVDPTHADNSSIGTPQLSVYACMHGQHRIRNVCMHVNCTKKHFHKQKVINFGLNYKFKKLILHSYIV